MNHLFRMLVIVLAFVIGSSISYAETFRRALDGIIECMDPTSFKNLIQSKNMKPVFINNVDKGPEPTVPFDHSSDPNNLDPPSVNADYKTIFANTEGEMILAHLSVKSNSGCIMDRFGPSTMATGFDFKSLTPGPGD